MDEQNPLRFEANQSHHIHVKERKSVEISGVKQIESFDANEFLLESTQGWIQIQGKELTLGKLDTEKGEVIIRGNIDSFHYIVKQKSQEKDGWFSKILRS